MKLKYIIVCSLLTTFFTSAQTSYKVLYSDGNVFVNGSLIKKGAFFKNTDSIKFKKDKGFIKICYSNCSIIKLIPGDLYVKSKSKSIDDYITSFEPMSSRSGNTINLAKLKNVSNRQKVAVVDTLKIPLNNY
jgi:hypothetical protein